jgi:hypothetical protein
MINAIHPLAAGELEKEPFFQLYRKAFGETAYAKRKEQMKGWRKAGQSEKEFINQLKQTPAKGR